MQEFEFDCMYLSVPAKRVCVRPICLSLSLSLALAFLLAPALWPTGYLALAGSGWLAGVLSCAQSVIAMVVRLFIRSVLLLFAFTNVDFGVIHLPPRKANQIKLSATFGVVYICLAPT